MFPFSVKQKQHEAENISIQLSHFSLESFNVAPTVAKQTQRELKNIIGSGGVLLKGHPQVLSLSCKNNKQA